MFADFADFAVSANLLMFLGLFFLLQHKTTAKTGHFHHKFLLKSLLKMSESSFSSFLQRNKIAIISTVSVVSVGALASYYYLNQATPSSTSTKSETASEGKKKKKSKKKTAAKPAKKYPTTAEGLPQLTSDYIAGLEDAKKDEVSTELKEDGNEYFKNKEFEKAIQFYTAALEIKEDPVFYSNRSACYVGLEDFEKVIEDTTKALELRPDYSKCLLRRSNAYEHLERYEDSMFDLTALTILGGFNNKSIESVLDRVLKKHSLNKVQENLKDQQSQGGSGLPSSSAITAFFGAFEKESPNDFGIDESSVTENSGDYFLVDALNHLNASTYDGFEKADNSFNQAIEAYKKELEVNVTPEVNEKIAVAFEYSGIFKFLKLDPLVALNNLEQSIQLHPRSRAYIFQALILADKQEFEGAQKLFDTAIELNPTSSETYYHRGQLYYLSNDLKNSRTNFEKAKELNPENIYTYIQLSCIDYREGSFEKAEESFQAAKKKFPTSPEIPNYYGEILGDKGDIAGAIKQFDISFKLQEALLPKISIGIIPLINKAAILAKQPSAESFAKASEILEKAISIDDKSELAKITLAQIKLQEQKIEDAIKLFEEGSILARNLDEKLQATSFAEASKIQLKVKNDPVLSKKIQEITEQYGAQNLY